MKKLFLSLAIISMCASPAYARGYGHYRGYDHHRHERGVDTGAAVAIGLGGLIIGSIIASQPRREVVVRERDPYYTQPYNPQQFCETVETRDRYGRLIDRRTTCYVR